MPWGGGLASFWRAKAPRAHVPIPLGYGLAVAMDRGPVTPPMGLVCPLSTRPLSIETLTFFSFL